MKYLKSYKELNEGLIKDKMVGVSDDELLKKLKKLNHHEILQYIVTFDLDHKYLPREEDGYYHYDGDLSDIIINYNYEQDDEDVEYKLPNNLKVNGTLDCSYMNLRKLPSGLNVKSLDCSYNFLEELPDDLIVEEDLNCSYNKLKKIPKLNIKGSLNAETNYIEEIHDTNFNGYVDLTNNYIKKLPNNLSVGDSLWLNDNYLKSLPNGLTVHGNLGIPGNLITKLPDDLIVKGALYTDNYNLDIPEKVNNVYFEKGGEY